MKECASKLGTMNPDLGAEGNLLNSIKRERERKIILNLVSSINEIEISYIIRSSIICYVLYNSCILFAYFLYTFTLIFYLTLV